MVTKIKQTGIADLAVGQGQLATDAVTAAKIVDGAVGSAEIGTDAVGTDEVTDGTITAADLAATLNLSGKTITLPATAIGMGVPHIILEHQQASGVGGGAFTSGADRTCTLNAEVRDIRSECALAANQFVLTAGTYYIEAVQNIYRTDHVQIFLHNVTGATELLRSMNAKSDAASDLSTIFAFLDGAFTVAAAQTLELRGRCSTTNATNGFGPPSSLGTERYARVKIWRIA